MAGYEYKDVFLEEMDEQLDILNNSLLALEKEPANVENIHNVFRVAHTLKSSAGFVGLDDLSDFAHKVENLIQCILNEQIEPTTEVVDVLFLCFDNIKTYIGKFAHDEELDIDFEDLVDKVNEILKSKQIEEPERVTKEELESVQASQIVETTPKGSEEIVEVDVPFELEEFEVNNFYEEGLSKFSQLTDLKQVFNASISNLYYINVFLEDNVKMKWIRGELILVNLERIAKIVDSIPEQNELKTDKFERNLEIIIETDEELKSVKDACDIDQVLYIIVKKITAKDLQIETEEVEEVKQVKETKEVVTEKITSESETEEEIIEEVKDEDQIIKEFSTSMHQEEKQEVVRKTRDVSSKAILSQSQSVRVPIEKLDSLLNLVGELAIVNSSFVEIQERFRQTAGDKGIASDLKDKIENLSNIAKSLQEGIMQSRMVPIGFVISRFNRLVRDLSNNLKKKVKLVIRGEDTELDKKIIDSIGEPLIHIVRNSIDHGIESEEERISAGKDPMGTIEIDAYQRGNHIIIDIIDDGKGLDKNAILKKAIDRKLVSESEAGSFDEHEIYNFIFMPGFSTAQVVTDLSGRGIGMNIVKETVESLNGSVSISTEKGSGTKFSLAFPLTMAIIPAVLCSVGNEAFAIPLYNVYETLKIRTSEIETIDFKEVLRLRNEVIELVRLSSLIDGISNPREANEKIPVIIVEFDNLHIGIVVDQLLGKREIVTKSISHYFKEKEMEGISGAALLGSGRIALILDVLALVKRHRGEKGSKKLLFSDSYSVDDLKRKKDEFMSDEETEQEIFKKLNITESAFKSMTEIFKIGISNASKNISKFLNSNVIISAPVVRIHKTDDYRKHHFYFGKGVYQICEMNITDNATGKFVLALDENSFRQLFSLFIAPDEDLNSEMAQASIMETTNILGASITNTLSNAFQKSIYISTPTLYSMDIIQYFDQSIGNFQLNNEYVWAILANIVKDENNLEGKIYIIPDQNTFNMMREAVVNNKELKTFIESVST